MRLVDQGCEWGKTKAMEYVGPRSWPSSPSPMVDSHGSLWLHLLDPIAFACKSRQETLFPQ